jgi:hypothetical protein
VQKCSAVIVLGNFKTDTDVSVDCLIVGVIVLAVMVGGCRSHSVG